jgi:hypothetical protein
MSFKKVISIVLLSSTLGGVSYPKVAAAHPVVVTLDPVDCRAVDGTPLPGKDGKDSRRCQLPDN